MGAKATQRSTIDGGYGWFVVIGGFLANAVAFGTLYSFTVFFPSILEEFGRGRGGTSWIVSIAAAVMLGLSGVTGRLVDRYGPRRVMGVGAVLMASGLALSSVGRSIWHVYLAYGLVLGIGISAVFLPAVATVGQWFDRRRGLATGLAVAGSGAGSVVMAPLSQSLIAEYGWRLAARDLAAGVFVVLLIAAVLVRGRGGVHRTGILGVVFKDRTFRLLYLSAVFASYGYWVPFVHLNPFALDIGLTPADAAILVSVLGASNTAGRVILGAIADRLGRRRIFQISMFVMGGSALAWTTIGGGGGLFSFTIVYGLFAGAFISLLPALTGDYFGVERLAGVMGLLNTGAAVGTLLGPPATGALFDLTGSYTLAILLAGGSMVAGASFLLGLPRPTGRVGPASRNSNHV